MRRFARLVHLAVAVAGACVFVFFADVAAQLPRGPLWWVPENTPEWPRHHDRWYYSPVEVVSAGAATSFPRRSWVSSQHRGYFGTAPENSACDFMDGQEIDVVGPPDAGRQDGWKTRRTPAEWGGRGGLQTSLNIGEYWQGRVLREYMTYPQSAATHRALYPGWNEYEYGSFSVMARDRNGVFVSPLLGDPRPSVSFPSDYGRFHLAGSNGMTLACAGFAVVMMHGTDRGSNYGVYPETPADGDGNPCYSTARLLFLRAQTEGRCEPDLRRRYGMTDSFWATLDPAREARTYEELVNAYGAERSPMFPYSDYAGDFPHLLGRRVEMGLFTVAEFAEADLDPIPWRTPPYPGSDAAGRRARLERFVDPATRPDATGGTPVQVSDYTGAPSADRPFEDCLEVGAAGWDAATGTFDPACAGREDYYTTPIAGFVNHEDDLRDPVGARAERTPEVGPRDNRAPVGGGATIRRFAGLWAPPAGFGWFEYRKSDLGCLRLAYTPDPGYLTLPEGFIRSHRAAAAGLIAEYRATRCTGTLDEVRACEAYRDGLLAQAERHMALAFGWRVILGYRQAKVPLLDAAFAAGGYDVVSGVGGATFRGVSTAFANRTCYRGPVGGAGYNARLAPVGRVHGETVAVLGSLAGDDGRAGHLVPGYSGRTWYREQLELGLNEHEAAGGGGVYGYHTEVRGEATVRARREAVRVAAATGDATPYPEDMGHDYSSAVGVRDTPYTFRDFACPTAGSGYYGMAVGAVGPSTFDHREDPDRAWSVPDPRIDVEDPESRYPSGTPCIPEDASNPLAAYYNVRGVDASDPASPGTTRCYDSERDPEGNFVPASTSIGAYSAPDFPNGAAAEWVLEYSGDGTAVTLQPGLERQLRPTSYVVLPNAAAVALGAPGSQNITFSADSGQFTDLDVGFISLDVSRRAIWSHFPAGYGYRIQSEEAYAGVAPGFSATPGADPDAAPADVAHIVYDGPVRFFGAMGLAGSGGCALGPSPPSGHDGGDHDVIRSVLDPDQHIVCLLPVDNPILQPTGLCPNPYVF